MQMFKNLVTFTMMLAVLVTLLAPRHVRAAQGETDLVAKLEKRAPLLLAVEPIEVVALPIEVTKLDESLRSMCTELIGLGSTLPSPDGPARVAPSLDETARAIRATDLTRAETDDGAKNVLQERVEAFAQQLAELRLACTHAVAFDTLTDADLKLLRAFAEDPERLVAVAALVDGLKKAKEEGASLDLRSVTDANVIGLAAGLRGIEAGQSEGLTGGAFLAGSEKALDGLAAFLVDRAKEEAINYLREILVTRLCSDALEPFVRETCKVLETVEHTTALRSIGKTVHRAIERDLERLPDVALVLAASFEGDVGYAGTAMRVGIATMRSAGRGADPVTVLASLHTMAPIDCEDDQVWAGIDSTVEGREQCQKTMALLRSVSAFVYAASQQSGSKIDGYWVTATLLAWEFRGKKIPDSVQWFRPEVSPSTMRKLADLATKVRRIVVVAQALIENLQDPEKEGSLDLERNRTLIAIGADAVGAAFEVATGIVDIAVQTLELRDVSRLGEDERKAHENRLCVLKTNRDRLQELRTHQALWQAVGDAEWPTAIAAVVAGLAKYTEIESRIGKDNWAELTRFLPVMVEIATAESSADVAATLEAAVPAGGYRSKYRDVVLSINGFLGFYGGGEAFLVDGNPRIASSIAMFAPIGVQVATPLGRGNARRKNWSVGGLVTIVDLGTITTRKITEEELGQGGDDEGESDAASDVPKLELRQLFSPGAYLTLGIAESPATLGVGFSYNPALRRETQGDGDDIAVWRFGAFLAIDITMFAFRLKSLSSRK